MPGPIQRRLAAILAADVAGHSRLMSKDEEGTLAATIPTSDTLAAVPESSGQLGSLQTLRPNASAQIPRTRAMAG